MTSRLRSPTSASTATTFFPNLARAAAILAVEVVLPTPPFPEVVSITRAALYDFKPPVNLFSLMTGVPSSSVITTPFFQHVVDLGSA